MTNPWVSFGDWLKQNVAPTLHGWLAPLDAWIDSLPLWTGTACALSLFIIVGLWACTLKRDYIYLGAPDRAAWRDLRIWTVLALLPYIIVYLFF
jgi:hypothetical protein